MSIIERRLTRLKGEMGKMSGKEKETRQQEYEVLERLYKGLESDLPIRDQEMSEEEARMLRGYQFLSAKRFKP